MSALVLARAGIEVEIVAKKFQSDLVSVVAGALWKWPPTVCGYHRDQTSLARSKEWAMESYEIFSDLARDPATEVFMRRANCDDAKTSSSGTSSGSSSTSPFPIATILDGSVTIASLVGSRSC
jgi:hypothetical protein